MDNIPYEVLTILAIDSEVNLFLAARYKLLHYCLLPQTTFTPANIKLTTDSTAD